MTEPRILKSWNGREFEGGITAVECQLQDETVVRLQAADGSRMASWWWSGQRWYCELPTLSSDDTPEMTALRRFASTPPGKCPECRGTPLKQSKRLPPAEEFYATYKVLLDPHWMDWRVDDERTLYVWVPRGRINEFYAHRCQGFAPDIIVSAVSARLGDVYLAQFRPYEEKIGEDGS